MLISIKKITWKYGFFGNIDELNYNFDSLKNALIGFDGDSTSATTTPTTSGLLGERVINSNPQPGSYLGWVCVLAGVAGVAVWKGYGLIED